MDVFMRNLDPRLSERALRAELGPIMDRLSIKYYGCDKHRNKEIAFVTFVNKADAEKFLAHHGQQVLPLPGLAPRAPSKPWNQRRAVYAPTSARLVIMGRNVFCLPSDRAPSTLAIQAIKHQVDSQSQQEAPPEAPVTLSLTASGFSCGHNAFDNAGRLAFVDEWSRHGPCSVKFTSRTLIVKLPASQPAWLVRIPFTDIYELVWSDTGLVAITLRVPPVFLRFLPDVFKGPRHVRASSLDDEHAKIARYCLVYSFQVLDVSPNAVASPFRDTMAKLKRKQDFDVTYYQLQRVGDPAHIQLPRYEEAAAALRRQLTEYTSESTLPYEVSFLLQALVNNGVFHPTTVAALADRLVALFRQSRDAGLAEPPISLEALKHLFTSSDRPSPHVDSKHLGVDSILRSLVEIEAHHQGGSTLRAELEKSSEGMTRVFRAFVTPARVTLHGPELEPNNRVLRKYPKHHGNFLRVQLGDENGQDLFLSPNISLDDIYARFKDVLKGGISVAGRTFTFLGFSHSSLRAHSVWMSAPFWYDTQLYIYERIIGALGDFDGIRSPARRAARVGQAFSETPYQISLDDEGISAARIPDVKRHGRVFSDGVGTISLGAVQAIHNVIPESKGWPTCFQIRWGGAKGMLSLDIALRGQVFCVRPSMTKFESEDIKNLEICDMASRPIPMVLNRQLVKILEDMGVPDSWFKNLQNQELRRLRSITASVDSTAKFLKAQGIGDAIQLHKLFRQTALFGVDYRRDPFLRSVVETVVLKELRLLKHKARIPVPEGITLFGILDETGFLEEGQVYVTYDTTSGRYAFPPASKARVLVTRSPALHPGDVQTACNMIPPEGHALRELHNCIVFSQMGSRDLPSQLAGGDLDGDVFSVIWDRQCVVEGLRVHEAAEYSPVQPLVLDRTVTREDMADFFVDFMRTDHLGVIAVRHMILADQRNEGTLHPDCLILANLHSNAVDFSKSGRPVDPKELPKAEKWRPDL